MIHWRKFTQGHTHTQNKMMSTFPFYCLFGYLLYRIKENGQERIEIEEDGVLKSVLINGKTAHTERHEC